MIHWNEVHSMVQCGSTCVFQSSDKTQDNYGALDPKRNLQQMDHQDSSKTLVCVPDRFWGPIPTSFRAKVYLKDSQSFATSSFENWCCLFLLLGSSCLNPRAVLLHSLISLLHLLTSDGCCLRWEGWGFHLWLWLTWCWCWCRCNFFIDYYLLRTYSHL